jgi:hypothetical protein
MKNRRRKMSELDRAKVRDAKALDRETAKFWGVKNQPRRSR